MSKKTKNQFTRKFIIQEFNQRCLPPGYCDVDGTVRDTLEGAQKLLEEFKEGKGYSMYDTNDFRIRCIEE